MRPLVAGDILDIDGYERVRPEYRSRVLAHKKARRVPVGPQVSLVFEDRETLRYQIQEMTRVERTTDPEKVQLEIDVYNELMPGPNELSATLFIEIPELDQIQPALEGLVGIDEHVAILVGADDGEVIRARFDERQMEEDRISAVHYIRFSLTPAQAAAFASGPSPRLRIDHPNYDHETILHPTSRESLTADLRGEPPILLDADMLARAREQELDTVVASATVRARRSSAAGARERIVVEPQTPTTLQDADPALLAELFEVTQRLARELQARTGGARVRLDLLSGEAGQLRFEITALR